MISHASTSFLVCRVPLPLVVAASLAICQLTSAIVADTGSGAMEPRLIASTEPGWPQFRGPRRDGISDERGLLETWPDGGPEQLWSVSGVGHGYSSPVIVGDRLYITGDFDRELHLLALDLEGRLIWRATNGLAWLRPYPGARSSVTYSAGRLYHQNAHGRLACFDAGTGEELWSLNTLERFDGANITWGLSECLLVDDRAVYVTVGGRDALLVALDKRSGEVLWRSEPLFDSEGKGAVESASYVSPILVAFGDRRLIFGSSVRHFFCANADTGRIYWTSRRATRYLVITMMPTLVWDGVFMTAPHSDPGRLYRMLPPSSPDAPVGVETIWTTPLDTAQGGVVHVNGRLFGSFYPGGKGWAAIDAADGSVLYETADFVKGALLYADKRLYALCEDGWMLLLDPAGNQFDVQGRFRLVATRDRDAWAHPVIYDGRLYLRYHDTLRCYDIRKPATRTMTVNPYADVDWATFEHHKAALHTHTIQSDGHHSVAEVVAAYRDAGFTILAITDHDNMTPNWHVASGRLPEEQASPYPLDPKPDNYPANTTWPWTDYGGPAPEDVGMIGIEGNELSYRHHMNSFFNSYGAPDGGPDEDQLLLEVKRRGGLAFLDHPGIDADWWTRRPVEWYAERFERHGPGYLIGIEVTNCSTPTEKYDEGLWDQLLARFMPERPIWGFGTDDMHTLASVRESHSVMLLPDLSRQAVRDAMEKGRFYFRKSSRRNDLRDRGAASELFPLIHAIHVDDKSGTITVDASNHDAIYWISAPASLEPVADYRTSNQPWPTGRVIHEGHTLQYRDIPDIDRYVRVELHVQHEGALFRTFTNPFGFAMVSCAPSPGHGLPGGDGPVIRAATVEALIEAIESAEPDSTVLVADGHYPLPRYVEVTADGVTIRSESGDREAVILDGAKSRHRELLGIRNASGVTIADLTIRNVVANGIKINNDTPVHNVTIRNCVLHNIWQRGVKSVRSPDLKTRNGVIEGCLFVNDRPKRFEDDASDTAATFDGNYVGAIDLMDAVGWRIRDNVFRNIQGRTRVGRGAIFIWFESQDCLIERNLIMDCDQGIALGNAHKPADTPLHASRFIVRNNVVVRAPMNPVFLGHTRDMQILHNSIQDPDNPRRRSIRIYADNDGLTLVNNLVHGHPIALEGIVGNVTIEPNFVGHPFNHLFVDPEAGNLRLRPQARTELPRFPRWTEAQTDWDGVERPDPTVPGAHKRVPALRLAPTAEPI